MEIITLWTLVFFLIRCFCVLKMNVLLIFTFLFLFLQFTHQYDIHVFGPGLQPELIVMPARYFYVNYTSIDESSYSPEFSKHLAVEITGKSKHSPHCRAWVNKLDRKDGSFIIRYKIYEPCYDLAINVYYKSKHVPGSPFYFKGPVQPDQCYCPENNFQSWYENYECTNDYIQINKDLAPFSNVNTKESVKTIIKRYHQPESTSFCHYVVKDNEIYRDCYGKHVGFNMFSDNILLFLTRKVKLPDIELVINLGDWPLIRKGSEPLPVFSWCGSNETIDIVMPTYDLTEATIENMGRVSLDTLSVQGGVERSWTQRKAQAVWRGRDSRAERLKLVDIARANPDLFNVSLTNFFFFRDKEAEYGPKQPHISFFKFFDYKYQINIDGTVAAYRMPYLLAGGGLVLKQDSPYYEHFYDQLEPWVHFVPVKRDLSDLTERIKWALKHDEDAKKIAKNARNFANEHLLPQNIICYHAALFLEWSKRITNKVTVKEGMTHVPQPQFNCDCENQKLRHEDL